MAADPSRGLLPELSDDIDLSGANLIRYMGGGAYKAGVDSELKRREIKPAEAPKENPLFRTLYEQRKTARKDYESRVPGLSDELYSNAASQGRRELEGTNRQIRGGYNSRGLLNSGMRVGAEAGATADSKSRLAGQRVEINQGLLSNLEQLESDEFAAASQLASPGANAANPFLSTVKAGLQKDASDAASNAQLIGGIGSGVGSIGGGILANTMYGQRNPTPKYGKPAPAATGNYGDSGRYFGRGGGFGY